MLQDHYRQLALEHSISHLKHTPPLSQQFEQVSKTKSSSYGFQHFKNYLFILRMSHSQKPVDSFSFLAVLSLRFTITACIWCSKFTVIIYHMNTHLKTKFINQLLLREVIDQQDMKHFRNNSTEYYYVSHHC